MKHVQQLSGSKTCITDKLCFLHNSLRQKHFAQARVVSSSKCALWTMFAQAESFSPRRESIFAQARKYFRPSEGTVTQAKKPLELVCFSGVLSPRREILRSGEGIFTPRQDYFRLGKNGQCSLDYFRSSEWYFRSGEICLAQARKRIFFLAFCF